MQITPYIYYKKGNQRSSNKEFKLLNILRMIKRKDIEQSLARILYHNSCVLGSQDENNDMHIMMNHDRAVNILNNTWCLDLGKHLVQLAPAYFQKSHLDQRNKYISKFLGFN